MGWRNPPVPWKELERRLGGASTSPEPLAVYVKRRGRDPGAGGTEAEAGGAGAPAGSGGRASGASNARGPKDPGARHQYAELHCHSNFSFLDGASHPDELVDRAVELGLSALAVTDHDNLAGVVRFSEAARAAGLPTVFGAELTLGLSRSSNTTASADPEGSHVLLLAKGPEGYARLSRTITEAQMKGGEKGRPLADLDLLGSHHGGHWMVLTGCRKGAVPRALVEEGPSAAGRELDRLVDVFGPANVLVELWDHGDPLDSARNDALVQLAGRRQLEMVATNNVHYATPDRARLAAALAAVRARRSLDEMDGWLPASTGACLRSGADQVRRMRRYPGVVEKAAEVAAACAFDLKLVAPKLPDWPTPDAISEMEYLRRLTYEGATHRYGPRGSEEAQGAWRQIDHELEVIEKLGFPGYFLVVWDIVQFCKRNDIFCQGRGSAANSAVCFALGITAADAVKLGLLFERFLSPERDGPPDIDVDIEAGRREEAIQYVYNRYGRERAAQVANVITYRPRSAVRDMGRALGHPPGQLDAWSKQMDMWSGMPGPAETDVPEAVMELAKEIQGFPRHLGIHSGGMVICDRPVVEVCPVEWARMPNRSVLQWDKDDCAAVGLVKFDLLGLQMLSALHEAVGMIEARYGITLDLGKLDQEEAVYDMLCRADSVGVFQVESRAQMATLPRLKPRTFYDLVVEVALIRPGPIQGGSVHPYIRRRNGQEQVTYLHPLLERSLAKTLGVPLFQEQLMQMAIDVAGFSASESDQLRQAMGSKRSSQRMEALKARLYAGMAERGVVEEVADAIWSQLAAFANFGFPESHSVSFAYLVYSSAWLKLHYPAAFYAGLLNAQPMGFWSPQTLVADARRHQVTVLAPDVNASDWKTTLEGSEPAVRLGLSYVRNLGEDKAKAVASGRPYASPEDLAHRAGLSEPQLEALATAGALGGFGLERREALWAAGALSRSGPGKLPGIVSGGRAPRLAPMTDIEEAAADLWSTGLSTRWSVTQFAREHLEKAGAVTAASLAGLPDGAKVTFGGVVTHRQRPATAGGTIFLNLEDETGMVNAICSVGVWARFRQVARTAPALLIRADLERNEGAIALVVRRIEALDIATTAAPSRDFR
ncbi:MAG TPA: error-prone DNA polymerase [Acidimicrobiales bacterium]|nr:error-prone DNA polymerase [Acidimicrobiales bacterium]